MTSVTIKLFIPKGDAKSLRTAEISNWTGKAVAAPRTELDELLAREDLDKAGIYYRERPDNQCSSSTSARQRSYATSEAAQVKEAWSRYRSSARTKI
jgi:hypothetical protein